MMLNLRSHTRLIDTKLLSRNEKLVVIAGLCPLSDTQHPGDPSMRTSIANEATHGYTRVLPTDFERSFSSNTAFIQSGHSRVNSYGVSTSPPCAPSTENPAFSSYAILVPLAVKRLFLKTDRVKQVLFDACSNGRVYTSTAKLSRREGQQIRVQRPASTVFQYSRRLSWNQLRA